MPTGYLPTAILILFPTVVGKLAHAISFKRNKGSTWAWYMALKKPSYNPPNWVFPIVWTTIYLCMGVSSYLILREGGWAVQSIPMAFYGIQILLNFAWSPLFFHLRRIDLVSSITIKLIATYSCRKLLHAAH